MNLENRLNHRKAPQGVSYISRNTLNPWVAIYAGKYVGSFRTAEEASDAYWYAKKVSEGKAEWPMRLPARVMRKTSGHRGVRLRQDGYWQAYYGRKHLGCFKTEAEAWARREQENKSRGTLDW
jgi:hypothetical protein